MLDCVVTVLALFAMGPGGAATLRRCAPWLTPLEIVAYGLPLGVVAASLATLALVTVVGLNWPLGIALSAVGLLVAWGVLQERGVFWVWLADRLALLRQHVWLFPVVVLVGLMLRWVWAWKDACIYSPRVISINCSATMRSNWRGRSATRPTRTRSSRRLCITTTRPTSSAGDG